MKQEKSANDEFTVGSPPVMLKQNLSLWVTSSQRPVMGSIPRPSASMWPKTAPEPSTDSMAKGQRRPFTFAAQVPIGSGISNPCRNQRQYEAKTGDLERSAPSMAPDQQLDVGR